LPIKLYAFVTMNKQGWLTRSADTIGGEGQDAASLRRPQAQPQVHAHVQPQLQPQPRAQHLRTPDRQSETVS